MSRIRYFRTDPKTRSYSPQFAAVSERLVSEDPEIQEPGHPYAVMGLSVTKRSFVPHFGEVDGPHRFKGVAKELGVHPEYLSHLYYTGTNNWNDGVTHNIAKAVDADNYEEMDRHIEWLKKQPELKPQTLFTEIEPTAQVTSFFSHSTMTTPAMTMGALAMNATGASHLIADDDLSSHSSRLAEHAQRLGVVKANEDNPDMDVTNDFGFEDENYTVHPDDIQTRSDGTVVVHHQRMVEIPEHEVAQARQTMRQILRGNRPAPAPKKNLSPQFDHPKLPGLEDF